MCVVLVCGLAAGCGFGSDAPALDPAEYAEFVRAFSVGLAALESGQDAVADAELARAAELAPDEPATWANRGILALRQQDLDAAETYLETARGLSPEDSRIEYLLGEVESRRGRLPEAIEHLSRAVRFDAGNYVALYALADQTERQATDSSDAEAQRLFEELASLEPDNVEVRIQIGRIAAKRGDLESLTGAVTALSGQSASWPPQAEQQLAALGEAVGRRDLPGAATQILFLRNVLVPEPFFREDYEAVRPPDVFEGEPFIEFLGVPPPDSAPSGADLATTFIPQPLAGVDSGEVYWVRAVYLDDSGAHSIVWADAAGVHLAGGASLAWPGAGPAAPPGRHVLAAADLDYDFRTDFAIAAPSGLRIYRQESPGQFVDVTAGTRLETGVIDAAYSGGWPFDFDLDGDLDLVVSPLGGPPRVLRNNGDGSFAALSLFPGAVEAASFAVADLDSDGDTDAAVVSADSTLHVFSNERLGVFRERPVPPAPGGDARAVTVGDVDGNGTVDLVVVTGGGEVYRLSDVGFGQDWEAAELFSSTPGSSDLELADFDNNGSLDVLVGDGSVYLSTPDGFTPIGAAARLPDVVDLDGDGRLDVIGVADAPVGLVNRGGADYNWQRIRTRAATATGDQRINSFGLGAEIQTRSGLLTQKQIVTEPMLHFGLGDQTRSDLVRIVWPNGLVQVEFDLQANQTILASQRLKGSCPSLFAWNGVEMAFVKDAAPWSPALGLRINAQDVAGIYRTEEWFRIPGSALVPRDGYYDLRITAELWETYYLDHYALMVVDHPPGTEIYSDERFAVPPPPLEIYTTAPARPFSQALDDGGQDVGAIVGELDRNYLDNFGRGPYQGVTRDHWVELELPPGADAEGPLYLIGDGWLHPTDASVNVALGQGALPPPEGLRIEVPDARGEWVVAREGLGFPAGKLKTVVLDLTGIFLPNAPRRLRLATNMEVYWDRLAWAPEAPDGEVRIRRMDLAGAELLYRGFSGMDAANASSPEIPDYNRVVSTVQKWRDLEGYYTRHGEIGALLAAVDDRIAIVNAGDEIRLRFPAPPPPPEGWTRDFVMVGDGWIKDGDYNSVYSKTVLPLPYQGMTDYVAAPLTLEESRAFQRHPGDWQEYHTRYIAPDWFRRMLRP